MNNYFEGTDIGVLIDSYGNTVMNNYYAVFERFISIAEGKEKGNIVMGSWNSTTASQDPTMCQLE